MLGALIIVFREVIEAGLIVGIVLAVTSGVPSRGRWIAAGVAGGVLVACLVAAFADGLSNALAGIHIAKQDSAPMILFVGQIERGMREREAFQEMDYRAVFGTQAKWVTEIDQVERIPEIVSRAFHVATSGRPGPVVIALPEDMLTELASAPVQPASLTPTARSPRHFTAIEASANGRAKTVWEILTNSAHFLMASIGFNSVFTLRSTNQRLRRWQGHLWAGRRQHSTGNGFYRQEATARNPVFGAEPAAPNGEKCPPCALK